MQSVCLELWVIPTLHDVMCYICHKKISKNIVSNYIYIYESSEYHTILSETMIQVNTEEHLEHVWCWSFLP